MHSAHPSVRKSIFQPQTGKRFHASLGLRQSERIPYYSYPVFCCLMLLLGAQTAPASAGPVDGGGIVMEGTIGDATSMIPMITTDTASSNVQGLDLQRSAQIQPGYAPGGRLGRIMAGQPGRAYHHLQAAQGGALAGRQALYRQRTRFFPTSLWSTPRPLPPMAGIITRWQRPKWWTIYTFRVTYKEVFAPGLASWGLVPASGPPAQRARMCARAR